MKAGFARLPWKNPAMIKKPAGITMIAVVGIGGSSQGGRALLRALNMKNTVFLDNIDPDFVQQTLRKLNPKKTLFIIISKSGETVEILALASLVRKFGASGKNTLFITDNPQSGIGKMAKKWGAGIIVSPKDVPGRFSVLSEVGLVPAVISGISPEAVLKGARCAAWRDAYQLARFQYLNYKKGRNIAVLFPYSEALGDFADWYIQLLAESIGKSKSVGITPVKAIGAKDQHSQLQLFLDGPDDKMFVLVGIRDFGYGMDRKKISLGGKILTLGKLFDAEYEGTKRALAAKKRPVAELTLKGLSAQTLGELFFFFELQVAFLGSLFEVNTENQPAVELVKKFTDNILGTSKKIS